MSLIVTPPPPVPTQFVRKRLISNMFAFSLAQSVYTTNGTTQLSSTDRVIFRAGTTSQGTALIANYVNPEFLFFNGTVTNTGIYVPLTGNGFSFKSYFEDNGNLIPVSFGNSTAVKMNPSVSSGGMTRIGDGEYLISKPLATAQTPFSQTGYTFRTYRACNPGEVMPVNYFSGSNGISGSSDPIWGSTYTGGQDLTTSYGTAPGNTASTAYAWGPILGFGQQIVPAPVCMVTGDSTSWGFAGTNYEGAIGTALAALGIQFQNFGMDGASTINEASGYQKIPQFAAQYVDYVLLMTGVNDLNSGGATVAQLQSYITRLVQLYAGMGAVVYPSTVNVVTTSTDGFTTYANQTKASYNVNRITYNNWMRDQTSSGAMAQINAALPAGCQGRMGGFIDVTPALEKNSDGSALVLDSNGQQNTSTGGYWITNATANYYTPDGTHLHAPAEVLVRSQINASRWSTIPLGIYR